MGQQPLGCVAWWHARGCASIMFKHLIPLGENDQPAFLRSNALKWLWESDERRRDSSDKRSYWEKLHHLT